MTSKSRQDTTLSVRMDKDTKEFYILHKGLSARVLKDFFKQWDAIRHSEKKKIKEDLLMQQDKD